MCQVPKAEPSGRTTAPAPLTMVFRQGSSGSRVSIRSASTPEAQMANQSGKSADVVRNSSSAASR
ncbi:hypothetical protein ACFFX0_09560 [Citricoccus parietis]|uniref:Uncharacterized protein n=1 Tax=Citricoccus parietis TaxID=592307 RepID=A0ABV5FXM3_9MICC